MYKTYHFWFSLHIFVNFMKREPSRKFCGVFHYFSPTYEVTELLCDVTNVNYVTSLT